MDIILASQNKKKIEEINSLFKDSTVSVVSAPQSLDVEETGDTYTENALLKAKAYYQKFNSPALSDDSGLEIISFPNILGVKSARYRPELKDYSSKCLSILERFQQEKIENRSACFTTVICLYLNHDECFFFEGKTKGKISLELKGEQGFGYDPIFIPNLAKNGLTYAQDPLWKFSNGHRAKALEALKKFVESQATIHCQK